MVNWSNVQNDKLIEYIESGEIDPHNLDGNYLYGKTQQLFPRYQGDGIPCVHFSNGSPHSHFLSSLLAHVQSLKTTTVTTAAATTDSSPTMTTT